MGPKQVLLRALVSRVLSTRSASSRSSLLFASLSDVAQTLVNQAHWLLWRLGNSTRTRHKSPPLSRTPLVKAGVLWGLNSSLVMNGERPRHQSSRSDQIYTGMPVFGAVLCLPCDEGQGAGSFILLSTCCRILTLDSSPLSYIFSASISIIDSQLSAE